MRKGIIGFCLLALGGCATAPQMVWLRNDGQPITNNAALEAQLEIDRTICKGDGQKALLSAGATRFGGIAGAIEQGNRNAAALDVAVACMAEKGYARVEASQAMVVSAGLAETAQQRRKLAEAESPKRR